MCLRTERTALTAENFCRSLLDARGMTSLKALKSPAFRGGNARLDQVIVKPAAISPAAGLIFLGIVKKKLDRCG
jgi:hypothetical protein